MGQTDSKEVIKNEYKDIRNYISFEELNEEQQKFLLDQYEKHIDIELKEYDNKCVNLCIRYLDISKLLKEKYYPNDHMCFLQSPELHYRIAQIVQLKVKRPFMFDYQGRINIHFIFYPIDISKID